MLEFKIHPAICVIRSCFFFKEHRCKMLAKLVSMSVALECSAVLECVAVWIMVRACDVFVD
jgi:hypothetical protein